jgi:tRNA nucleotidyltransferase (CCA-adding enzyme)
MEQGANLTVANEFLHHSLTPSQRDVYERLMDAATTHDIGGHPVVVALATASGYEEEISTLAHKLRELLEPSALFVLVALDDYVQLVARSSTDDIDVSAIAMQFGGGGHTRAAAAMIRDRDLEAVQEDLMALLPEAVRPAATVEQIMSRGVQVLPPGTSVAEADDQMRRTGHEGYPVVERGHVIGLLTRRAVDRALQFNMAASPISQVMEPGSLAVAPQDAAEKLQRLMIDSGWGQIPVVHNDEILGVVTRTDLITLWGTPPSHPRQSEIETLLARSLPAHTISLVRYVAEKADAMGYSLYFVGGLVRDLLLGISNVDVDLVVEGDAIQLAQRLVSEVGGRIVAHSRFGTAKWLLDRGVWLELGIEQSSIDQSIDAVDFATARTEFYTYPSALPEVERSAIKQDLHRRDFTINTLAIRLDPPHWGELLDFYGGEADLHDKVIRVLHSLSFVDDPTRILRAARLETRLGFELDPRSEELIANALPLLKRVSGDRIRHEIEQIFEEDDPAATLCRLDGLGVLSEIHPSLRCDRWLTTRYQTAAEELDQEAWGLKLADRCLVYLALLVYRLEATPLDEVLTRLKVPRSEVDDLALLPSLRQALRRVGPARRPSQISKALRPYPAAILAAAWIASGRAGLRSKLLDYQSDYRHVESELTGDDLKELGLQPGPLFGQLLEALRDARMDGRISSREDELKLVHRLVESNRADA